MVQDVNYNAAKWSKMMRSALFEGVLSRRILVFAAGSMQEFRPQPARFCTDCVQVTWAATRLTVSGPIPNSRTSQSHRCMGIE